MPSAPIQRVFEAALGHSKNIVSTAILPSVDRLRSAAPAQPRAITGTSVRGRASVQPFGIASPGTDGFAITLPGTASQAWQGTLTVRAQIPADVQLSAVLSAARAVPNTGTDGVTVVSSSTFGTFYGGDPVTCQATLTGTPGGPYTVTVDFSAISIPGGN